MRGLTSAVFICVEVFIPLPLTSQRDMSAIEVGVGITLGACSWALASWWQGRDHVTWPPARLVGYGTTLLATGSIFTGLLVFSVVPVVVGFAGWLVCGLGMGLSYPPLSAPALDLSDDGTKGRNTASLKLTETLFTAVALTATSSPFAHCCHWDHFQHLSSASRYLLYWRFLRAVSHTGLRPSPRIDRGTRCKAARPVGSAQDVRRPARAVLQVAITVGADFSHPHPTVAACATAGRDFALTGQIAAGPRLGFGYQPSEHPVADTGRESLQASHGIPLWRLQVT